MEVNMVRHTMALLLLAGIACALVVGCGGGGQATAPSGLGDKGAEFVTLLADGRYDEAVTWLDPAMAAAMPAAKLEEAWKSLSSKGPYQGQAGTRTAKEQGFDVVFVTCNFAQGAVDVKVVFDPQGKVGGLWFVPPRSG
jgi:hypothetical protein